MGVDYLRFLKTQYKQNVAELLEYPVSFLGEVTAMMASHFTFLWAWYIVFSAFNTINGWEYLDLVTVICILRLADGTAGIFFGGKGSIAKSIEDCSLDLYLTLPINEILHLLVRRSGPGAFGHIIMSLSLMVIFIPSASWLWVLFFSIWGIFIILGTQILAASVTFWIGRDIRLEHLMHMSLLSFGGYPSSVFSGFTRLALLTVLPLLFIGGIPAGIIRSFDWQLTITTVIVALAYFTLSIAVFYKGLRRYESGSLITVRL